MKFLVTDIEFDFDDGNDGERYSLTYDEQTEIRDQHLGVWEADNEDDMIDEITAASGWLIKNIYFDPQNPEFCKKMVAKYGENWHIDDFHNDTSDDFVINRRAI